MNYQKAGFWKNDTEDQAHRRLSKQTITARRFRVISPELCRGIVRNWMRQHGRVGRSNLKRLFRQILEHQQGVELLPGLYMQLDLRQSTQDSIFWFYEEVEPALQWAIRTLLPVGGTFFDVGANVGLLGLLAIH